MAFKIGNDYIGAISHLSGVITLQPSLLTIGGQQYRTPQLTLTLPTLTANTPYMLFVVMSGSSSFQLVASTNFNSVGPVGYSKWKLVRAFWSDGVTGSVALGQLFDPTLPTQFDYIPYTTTMSVSSGTLTNFVISNVAFRRTEDGRGRFLCH